MQIARSVHPLAGEAERKARLLDLVDRFGISAGRIVEAVHTLKPQLAGQK